MVARTMKLFLVNESVLWLAHVTRSTRKIFDFFSAPVDNMSEKTGLLIVEVEKHPILYDKGRRDFKEAEKKKNAWKIIAIFMRWCTAAHIADCHSLN